MIVLDTHTWIWFIDNPSLIPKRSKQLIEKSQAEKQIHISSISVWEIYTLEGKGRLNFKIEAVEWVRRCERLGIFNFVPIDNDIVKAACNLPGNFHRDPADRFIVGLGRFLDAPVITKDEKIRRYPHIKAIWD